MTFIYQVEIFNKCFFTVFYIFEWSLKIFNLLITMIRKITYQLPTIIILFLSFSCFAQRPGESVLFNNAWKFHKGDLANAENISFNDDLWQSIDLPHDWSIEGPFSEQWASCTAFLPGGIGWYRKTFKIPADMRSKELSVYFDGVYKNSTVWINGHLLGNRPNGFIPFEYDLTKYLSKSGNNVIAVKVDHSQFADSRWYTGSGINRNVYLIAAEPVHIAQWGVVFTTPQISEKSAKATVSVSVNNNSSSSKNVTVDCSLIGPSGKMAAGIKEAVGISANGKKELELHLDVAKPQLWSVDNPNLYRLEVAVYTEKKLNDKWADEVCFRGIRFDPDKGFFLNGKNMKLKGVCLHDDAGALGTAVPEEVWERRLRTLKAGGCNAIRMSHNPHADYFYKLCDRLGFLVMDEAFDEWETGKNKWIEGWNVGTPGKDGYHEYFAEWADRDLSDMIRRNINRPSVIMWSIGNEIDYPNDPYSAPILNTGRNPQIYGKGYLPDHPPASRLGELSARLVKEAKEYDTTRPVTAALAGIVMSNTTTFPGNLDIVGYNYQEYRYSEDHKEYPGRVIYGSENGRSLGAWNAVDSNAFISAQFLWTGVDYLGEAGRWPSKGSGAGLLNLAGFPKPTYYFRKSIWTSRPMIYLGVASLSSQKGRKYFNDNSLLPVWNWTDGEKVKVGCFTNCAAAELFLNGKSLGKKTLQDAEGRIIYWDIDYQPGTLIVKGYNNTNETLAKDTLTTAGDVYTIKSNVYKNVGKKESTIRQIELQLIDKKGNPVYQQDHEITIHIDGAAKLLGIESGSLTSHEDYKMNKRMTLDGKLIAYVQKKTTANKVRVTIETTGLQSKTIVL